MANPATQPIQVNLGTLNLNAWQQLMIINGSQINTDATVGAHVLAPGVIAGFAVNYLFVTAAGGVTITTRTALQMFQDIIAIMGQIPAIGMSWEFEIANSGGGTITLAPGTGVTTVTAGASTMTLATGSNKTWVLTYTGGGAGSPVAGNPTFTIQPIGTRTN